MKDSAKDDHKPLQESLMETYHETSKVEEQTRELKKQLTDKGEAEKAANQTSNSTAKSAGDDKKNQTKTALPQKYTDSPGYKSQVSMLQKLSTIYQNPSYSPLKKVQLFTSEICVPEILSQEKTYLAQYKNKTSNDTEEPFIQIENEKDKELIPLMCFVHGVRFLKRLPSVEEITD